MKKAISIILFVIYLILPQNVYALDNLYVDENTNYKVIIEDDAKLLSTNEKEKLLEDMKPLTKFGNIIFKSINTNNYYSTEKYARNYYYENFENDTGTLFLIDKFEREIYICSEGENYKKVTTYKAQTITDNIYELATKEQYYECAKEAYNQIYKVLNNEKIAEPMKYICNALISLIISQFMIFLIVVKVLNSRNAKNKEIIDNAKIYFEFDKPEVQILRTHRIYSPIESSSGGIYRGRRTLWWPEASVVVAVATNFNYSIFLYGEYKKVYRYPLKI